jgi:hypothetical protein
MGSIANYLEDNSPRTLTTNLTMSSFLIFPGPDTSIKVVSVSLRPKGSRRWETFRHDGNSEPQIPIRAVSRGSCRIEARRRELGRAHERRRDEHSSRRRRPNQAGVQSLRHEAGAQGDRSAKAINLFIENQPVSGRASPLRLVTLALACFGGEPILFSQRSRHVGSRIASEAGVPGAAPRPTGYFARIAILQLFSLLCAATALGCALLLFGSVPRPRSAPRARCWWFRSFFVQLGSPRSS